MYVGESIHGISGSSVVGDALINPLYAHELRKRFQGIIGSLSI